MFGGYNKIFEFDNGYGASVICNDMSYGGSSGLFEVAVMKDGYLCYDTPITRDVEGFLDFAAVADILARIQKLPKVSA